MNPALRPPPVPTFALPPCPAPVMMLVTARGPFASSAACATGGWAPLLGQAVRSTSSRALPTRLTPAEGSPDSGALSPSGATAWAPNEPQGTWATAALPVSFVLARAPAGPSSRDLGDDAGAEIDVALRTWSHVFCTGYRARYGGLGDVVPGDDGTNAVFFHDDAWPAELAPGAAAQTVVYLDASGQIHDADVHLNSHDFRFSRDGASGTLDLRSILVHELGHALGLGHSSDARATMALSGSGLRWRSLEHDDIDGVCALYPGVGAPGCDVDPCPTGWVCVGDVCERPGERENLCSPCEPTATACEAAGDDARCVDLGAGGESAAGRVCGRACAPDGTTACPRGFRCVATTEAGDFQCVAEDGCRSAANACASDLACPTLDGDVRAVCRGGACMGPSSAAEGASADAGADGASLAAVAPSFEAGGGCSLGGSPRLQWGQGEGKCEWACDGIAALLLAVVGFTARRVSAREATSVGRRPRT